MASAISTGMGRKRRVFIVDDHPLVREGLANLINQQSDLVVCGQAEDAAQALAGIGASRAELGLTPEEVSARYPDGYRRWLAGGTGWSEGETYAQMAKRGLAGARDIVARHTGSEAPIVIVTHGGVIRALVLHILGLPLEARRFLGTGPTSTITEVDARAPDWRLRSFNDAGHRPRA